MNSNEILELVRAGFTKDDIMALSAPAQAAEPEVKPNEVISSSSVPLTSPAEEKAPEAAPPASGELPPAVASALEQINATLSKLQQYAIRTDGQPEKKTDGYKEILGSTYNRKD